MKQRKVLICCNEKERIKYEEKAKAIYGTYIQLVETLAGEPDIIFVIQPENVQTQEVVQAAAKNGTQLCYMTEQFIPMKLYERLLRDD